MTRLKDLKKRLMNDADFREEYERADEEFAMIETLIRARTAARLTQEELARRLGTTRSAATLRRYAEVTGTRLMVALVPADN